jgi:hypothetical protein
VDAPLSLDQVLRRIKDPQEWTDPDFLVDVLRDRPSVRGMVYGFLAEMQLARWLHDRGVPLDTHVVDDDHAKTKSDRTIPYKGKHYTIQVKSMQTNSIKEAEPGVFRAGVQCDGSDRREVTLPNGNTVSTTNYVAGEFMVLATALHPFTGSWDFAFRLNSTLERTTSKKYAEADRHFLLKTMVPIGWPLETPWTTDLFALLDESSDLGEVLDEGGDEEETVVRPPGTDAEIRIDDD